MTKIRKDKDYLWFVYNEDTLKDAVIVEKEEKVRGKEKVYFRVDSRGERMTGKIKHFKDAKKFAFQYVEGKI